MSQPLFIVEHVRLLQPSRALTEFREWYDDVKYALYDICHFPLSAVVLLLSFRIPLAIVKLAILLIGIYAYSYVCLRVQPPLRRYCREFIKQPVATFCTLVSWLCNELWAWFCAFLFHKVKPKARQFCLNGEAGVAAFAVLIHTFLYPLVCLMVLYASSVSKYVSPGFRNLVATLLIGGMLTAVFIKRPTSEQTPRRETPVQQTPVQQPPRLETPPGMHSPRVVAYTDQDIDEKADFDDADDESGSDSPPPRVETPDKPAATIEPFNGFFGNHDSGTHPTPGGTSASDPQGKLGDSPSGDAAAGPPRRVNGGVPRAAVPARQPGPRAANDRCIRCRRVLSKPHIWPRGIPTLHRCARCFRPYDDDEPAPVPIWKATTVTAATPTGRPAEARILLGRSGRVVGERYAPPPVPVNFFSPAERRSLWQAPRIIDEPIERFDESTEGLDSPAEGPESPVERLDSPVERLDEPIQRLDSPVDRFDEPLERLDEPIQRHDEPAELPDEQNPDDAPNMTAHHARFIEIVDAFIVTNDQTHAENDRLQREMREMEFKHDRHSRDVFRILEELEATQEELAASRRTAAEDIEAANQLLAIYERRMVTGSRFDLSPDEISLVEALAEIRDRREEIRQKARREKKALRARMQMLIEGSEDITEQVWTALQAEIDELKAERAAWLVSREHLAAARAEVDWCADVMETEVKKARQTTRDVVDDMERLRRLP